MTVAHFLKETAAPEPFRHVVRLYAQANLLQTIQCTACNALHDVANPHPRAKEARGDLVRIRYEVIRAQYRRLGF
jgi:hypothetical protein